ncbi:MAG: nascent polypeptide-associated complex protein [Candidatus Geothermarchaeales archaeon]
MKRFSPRELRRMMRRAGINVEQLDGVDKVEIHLQDGKVIVVSDPSVTKMNVSGQTTFQVAGQQITEVSRGAQEAVEEALPTISEEDVLLVAQQAGVDSETARRALEMTGGDLAQAILMLKGR